MSTPKEIRWGIIGYGGAFNMGRSHTNQIQANEGMRVTTVCDLDPARTAIAKEEFPDIVTYNDHNRMLEEAPVDAVVLITPHNTHAKLAVQALNAGKHVVTEKPMCITVDEADAMIAAGRANGKMLSVFHNRRWDGDHLTIMDVIEKGLIGEVFHLEAATGGWNKPREWWRAHKEISGGAFYDWGAHFLYWILRIVPGPIDSVTGFFHPNVVWKEMTNEDQVQALVRFKSGAVVDMQMSSVAMFGRAKFRILGTKGAILDEGKGSIRVKVNHEGYPAEFEVKYQQSQHPEYYKNLADHLLRGAPLEITAESARRVIAVMDLAERSSKTGMPEKFPEIA